MLHKRLGHPKARILHDLSRKLAINGLDGTVVKRIRSFPSSILFRQSRSRIGVPPPLVSSSGAVCKRTPAILRFCRTTSLQNRVCNITSIFLLRCLRVSEVSPLPYYSNRIVERATSPLGKVHSDICGPLPVPSLTGCCYFMIFIDEFSRFMFTYPLKARSDLPKCYEDFRKKALNIFRKDVQVLEWRRQHIDDEETRVLQADIAKKYENLERLIFSKYGTHVQFTNAYTSQQNGAAEWWKRTILEYVRALLLDGNLPKQLWAECVCHVTTRIKMTSSSKTDGLTPYELWYKRIPSMIYIKVFGCSAYVHITEQYRDKLDACARLCMYLSMPYHKKGYRLLDINTHPIVYCRDVTFKEDEFPSLADKTTPPRSSKHEQTRHLAPAPLPPLQHA
ncbi:Hypothetical protein PHPALM_425 [Phytophthora palmivora]|uniref:Integrase catalytic domain-containing protein n=1 Tax=Phytophthora palmivora TaxID=4796 RepID=A0A2P4YUX3_9STRA|nr:Hypothetical protein PHPALM_425 [Phytophthora palmivora]